MFLLLRALHWGEETTEMEKTHLRRTIKSHNLAVGQELRHKMARTPVRGCGPWTWKADISNIQFQVSLLCVEFFLCQPHILVKISILNDSLLLVVRGKLSQHEEEMMGRQLGMGRHRGWVWAEHSHTQDGISYELLCYPKRCWSPNPHYL